MTDSDIINYKEYAMEAVMDFVARLKEKAYTAGTKWSHGKYLLVIDVDDIDEILAEMEGENEENP